MMTIDDSKENLVQHSLIQHFDRELDKVRDEFQDVWTQEAEFNLQNARLYLFAVHFVSHGSPTRDDPVASIAPASASSRVLLLSGLTAAVRMIHIFSRMGDAGGDSSTNAGEVPLPNLKYYPKMYYGHICAHHISHSYTFPIKPLPGVIGKPICHQLTSPQSSQRSTCSNTSQPTITPPTPTKTSHGTTSQPRTKSSCATPPPARGVEPHRSSSYLAAKKEKRR